ncbi:MAG TPA: ABC transporter permease, partial [Acetobacteraceae bacterium]|nr:ABC transporter permease [Acetobacteraceae bacterium]
MAAPAAVPPSAVSRFFDSDLWHSFSRSPVAVLSALVALLCIGGAVLAPWIAPQDPFDLATLNLSDAFKPPAWTEEGDSAFPFGSDDQGRDVFSAILHGARISLLVGVCAVLFSTLVGVSVGLTAGYMGGTADALLMRI